MSETSTLIGYSGRTIGREELALVPTPAATETHRPIPHHEIVRALIETLGFRHIGVVHDEYAVSPDGMKMFGVLDLATEIRGVVSRLGSEIRVTRACVWPWSADTGCSCAPTWRSPGISRLGQCDN